MVPNDQGKGSLANAESTTQGRGKTDDGNDMEEGIKVQSCPKTGTVGDLSLRYCMKDCFASHVMAVVQSSLLQVIR